MFDDLGNKNITIAGGTGLIGSALTKAFTDLGCNVTTLSPHSGQVQFDLSCGDDSRLDQLLSQQLRPEVWINCTYPRDYRDHLAAYVWSTRCVAEWMAREARVNAALTANAIREREKEGTKILVPGTIILFSSIYGGVRAHDPRRYNGTEMYTDDRAQEMFEYSAVKAGVVALTRALAVHYAPFIRINCISPGGVSDDQPYEFVQSYNADTPLGRMARPEDLVGPVMFLASSASGYVTGHNLVVDGGITLC